MAGQVWARDAEGGFMYSPNLTDVLHMVAQPRARFRQFTEYPDESDMTRAKGSGDTVNWNIYGDLQDAGAVLDEELNMPETQGLIRQGSLIVTEYGISVPFTRKLQELGQHECEKIIKKQLANNCVKSLDAMCYDAFSQTPLRVTPEAGNNPINVVLANDGNPPPIDNNIGLQKGHIGSIVDMMSERDIPVYNGEDYYAIARPTTLRSLRQSLEAVNSYTETGFSRLVWGEVGRFEGVRFLVQTNVAAKNWANGMSDEVVFFGDDTVVEAPVVPEEIRGRIPGDYGRKNGMAWYSLTGAGIIHPHEDDARVVIWSSQN